MMKGEDSVALSQIVPLLTATGATSAVRLCQTRNIGALTLTSHAPSCRPGFQNSLSQCKLLHSPIYGGNNPGENLTLSTKEHSWRQNALGFSPVEAMFPA